MHVANAVGLTGTGGAPSWRVHRAGRVGAPCGLGWAVGSHLAHEHPPRDPEMSRAL